MPQFLTGVNYWPRHQGVRLWKDWTPEDIRSQFAEMNRVGLDLARVFLLWEDFQPVREYRGYMSPQEPFARGHASNPDVDIEAQPGYLDPTMLDRFDRMIEFARENDLRLIPTLLVGWMSGTCFEPPHLRGRNIFTDPSMLHYQIVYMRAMADRYKDEPVIYAWDLGNEQNCFQPCASRDAAWTWTCSLTGALKLHDPNHLVTSGMHSLAHCRLEDHAWMIQDVAEHCDFTTVHPYPGFFEECHEELTHPRTTYLPAWQNRLYEGVGGKPVMCQEFGSLGGSAAREDKAAVYARTVLGSLLANESMGALWWCHTDFTCLDSLPYAVNQMTSLLNTDRYKPARGVRVPRAQQYQETRCPS